ncbi:MAG TPA: aspartyl protease family protein [Pirellulaceae bacterium]|nr:aspartyl protease family protein [Pirellulaceae bacterium]
MPSPAHYLRCGFATWLALLLCLVGNALQAEDPRPADVLEAQGLARLGTSNYWGTKLEQELRIHLSDLPKHRAAISALEQSLLERIEKNAAEYAAAQRSEAALQATFASLPTNDPARKTVAERIKAVQQLAIPPARLAGQDDTRQQLIELTNHRHALWVAIGVVRRDAALLAESYAPLAKNDMVLTALRKLGGNHRLGPAKNYADDLRKLGDFERAVQTDWVPLYLQGDKQRVTALIDETTPMTFTWSTSPETSYITTSMAAAAGLEIPQNAAIVKVTPAKGRTFPARRVVLPYVRFGKYLLRDVEVVVLPPEGEDLGAQLSAAALSGVRASAQLNRLRLQLDATQ